MNGPRGLGGGMGLINDWGVRAPLRLDRQHINGSLDGAQQNLERGARLRRRRGGPVGTQRLPDLPGET